MKRILPVLLVLCLVLSFSACTNRSETQSQPSQTTAPLSGKTMTVQYSENYAPFQGNAVVSDVARIDNQLLFAGALEGKPLLGLAEYNVSETGRVILSETASIPLDQAEAPDEAEIYDITAGGDGYFYVLTGNARSSNSGNFKVLRYAKTGEYQDQTTISAFKDDTQNRFALCVDSSSRIILMGKDYTYMFPWQGSPAGKQVLENQYFECISLTSDGPVLSIHNMRMDGSPFYLVDPSSGELKQLSITNPYNPAENVEGFKNVWGGSFGLCQGLNGEYISNSGEKFILLDFANDSFEELLRWNYSSYDCGSACRLSQDSYICVIPGTDSLLLTGMEETAYKEKTAVRVALIGLDDSILTMLNNTSQEYSYEATCYTPDNTDRFMTDLTAGDGFDLVVFAGKLNTSSSQFDDLFKYIDTDPDLTRDSFLPNFLDSLSSKGELHQIWDRTYVSTLAARTSDLGGRTALTPADYKRIVEDDPKIEAVFDTFMSKNALLGWVAEVGISTCVDRDHAACHFDSQEFTSLLAWCMDMGNDQQEGVPGISYDPSQVILFPYGVRSELNCSDARNYLGDRFTFVGFPNGGDGFHYYVLPNYDGVSMAIPVNSQNKDGAWAFIRSRLSMEAQLNIRQSQAGPVIYDAFRRIAEENNPVAGDCELIYDLLTRTHYASLEDPGLKEIIIACGQGYLAGDKSLTDTINLIQSRASIYVSEQYS